MTEYKHELITIQGQLAAWRYLGGGDGWGTGALADGTPVVGTLLGARVSDQVELTGSWHQHPRYGRQFKFRSITAALPPTPAGVVAWLVHTLPGIGQKRAQALVERFGDALWHTLEVAPESLTEIPGITASGAEKIRAAYFEHRDDRDAMVALRGWGLTDSQIKHCRAAWGTLANVVDHVRANPYELCHHVYGFGFKRADRVALDGLRIARNAPERITAALEHLLSEAADAGHCWVSARQLERALTDADPRGLGVGCTAEQVVRAAREAVSAKRVVRVGWRFYPARLARAEEQCAEHVRGFL